MVVNDNNAGVAGKILFGSDAKVNFTSEFFCKRNNIAFRSSAYSAETANGMKQALFDLTSPVEAQVHS